MLDNPVAYKLGPLLEGWFQTPGAEPCRVLIDITAGTGPDVARQLMAAAGGRDIEPTHLEHVWLVTLTPPQLEQVLLSMLVLGARRAP